MCIHFLSASSTDRLLKCHEPHSQVCFLLLSPLPVLLVPKCHSLSVDIFINRCVNSSFPLQFCVPCGLCTTFDTHSVHLTNWAVCHIFHTLWQTHLSFHTTFMHVSYSAWREWWANITHTWCILKSCTYTGWSKSLCAPVDYNTESYK